MSFTKENGYLPPTVETIMNSIMTEINAQFQTTYTPESFLGTNHYKFNYATAQRIQSGEIKTSEIFLKLQQYIDFMNLRISRPVTTNPGIIEKFLTEGFRASVKPPSLIDAGKLSVCLDINDGVRSAGELEITVFANLVSGTADTFEVGGVTFTAQAGSATPGTATFQAAVSNAATALSLANQINAHATTSAIIKAVASGQRVILTAKKGGVAGNAYALVYVSNGSIGGTVSGATMTGGTDNPDYEDLKLEVCTILSQISIGGVPTQGTETETITLSNGQSFDFSFYLPNRMATKLKLTITTSENNQVVIKTPDQIRENLLANINLRYALGKNFEPQRYYSVVDAPWAAQIVLEYSLDDGVTYSTAVYDTDFDELFDINLEDIELIEV
jgi:hypothetical protein